MYKKMYFMGIKGVGMATLAVIAKQAGIEVSGSDIDEEFITDKTLRRENILIKTGFNADNVSTFFATSNKNECLFIATGAHDGFDNPEAVFAKKIGIKVISHGEAVGLFMSGSPFGRKDIEGVSVAGAHGKTTIASMIATVLSKSNLDPSYTIGTSEIKSIGSAGHYGKGRYFIAEADEYVSEANYDPTPKFLHQSPAAILVNNIDFDHPDFYRNIEVVKNAYLDFIFRLPENGILAVNGDDANISDLLPKIPKYLKIIKYGTGKNNNCIIHDFVKGGFSSTFKISQNGTLIGDFTLKIPGYHNAKNASGVIALLLELGLSAGEISSGLSAFSGVKRRLEVIGKTAAGNTILDDYAHHPEEIKKTLEAVRDSFPEDRIVLIFQPHTYSRTKALFGEFVSALTAADEILLLNTFASARDEKDNEGLDQKFTGEFEKINKDAHLLPTRSDMVEYVNQNIRDNAVIITMGAGDVYKVGYDLAVHLENEEQ